MEKFKAKITLFHCINAFTEHVSLSTDDREVKIVKMPCSGMTTEVFMLKAFEAGADAVAILVCPEGACRYMEGNMRARKRVEKTSNVLDKIGVGGKRLSIHNLAAKNSDSVPGLLDEIMSTIKELGKNPAAAA
ncbi:MAG: hydrogenase iron-sulfur subunit [Proteobacteria bacterium]|nr:hydrogenase iron-sulfur subunit [Pseudomonadota bacterium]